MSDLSRLGVQSWSLRAFDLEGAIKGLKELGLSAMEFCNKHFAADADDDGFEQVKALLAAQGVTVPCFGVEAFTADAAANRVKFAFAKALGVQSLSANPTADAFDNLEELVEEFGITIAIHNHGPQCDYSVVADTLRAVEGRHPLIGACVDTGHALRSAEKPADVIEQLGDRVHSVHLKDWVIGGDECIPGEGDADLVAVAKALDAIGFAGPINVEYEENMEAPLDDMKVGIANWREAVAQI